MKRFEGKVCVVTGGVNGLGAASVRRFLEEGASVAIGDIEADGAATVRAAVSDPARVHYVHADVTKPEDLKRLAAEAKARFGRIDVLHANAGRVISGDGLVHEVPIEAWDALFAVNAKGVYLTCRAILPALIENGGGAIVITASYAATRSGGAPIYASTKAAVVGLTRTIARQYGAHNIRCNAIAPGSTDTQIMARNNVPGVRHLVPTIPMKRIGRPEEVAALVAFLASDEAARITGGLFPIDGGWSAF
jgi:NAD(P)-dependent dehydrogenase (short-subunit alcohol dehydrogenase family)